MIKRDNHISDSILSQRTNPELHNSNERGPSWCAEKDLFEEIVSYENILLAWKKTQRLRRYRSDVLEFRENLDQNLIQIQESLINDSYQVGTYRNFYVFDPKKRLVSALPLKDRVVQHALSNIIEPIIDKSFFYDSHACRKGHGTILAVKQAHKFSKKNNFVLKCDVTAYFASIDHKILINLYDRKIKCQKTLKLIDKIINSTISPGIPVGNLISQFSANLYLHELDFFIKHTLKIKNYVRYMDDFLIFCESKEKCNQLYHIIKDFCDKKLKLTLSYRKCRPYLTQNGFPFCGSMIFKSHTKILNKTIKKNRKKLRKMAILVKDRKLDPEIFLNSIQSILGHSIYSRNYSYRLSISDVI